MRPKDSFAQQIDVSRETLALYEVWCEALFKWNARINLVAKSTLPDFWNRHALDSWQITPHLRETDKTYLDFGSGAGFPAIAVAIASKVSGVGSVTLTESAGKKASFLKSVIRDLDLPAVVHGERIEDLEPFSADVITARAFAPLPRLLNYAAPFLSQSTRLILLKGVSVEDEIEAARESWTFDCQRLESLSDEAGCVLIIENVKRL